MIDVRHLSHVFPDGTAALQGVSLHIKPGEFVVLAGANGSGKTVLTRHLNGLLSPTSGEVLVDGVSVQADPMAARQKVGLIFQNVDSQIVAQTVMEDASFGPENLGLPQSEVERCARESLRAVGLDGYDQKDPRILSGGQKRRLAIAGVLAMNPQVLVLDEPFVGLDLAGVQCVLEQVVSLHGQGHTIVLVTHELEKCLAHATRLVVLSEGQKVLDGSPAETIADVEKFGLRNPLREGLAMCDLSWL